ncbi:hypothetical protein [Hyphomonas sp.]
MAQDFQGVFGLNTRLWGEYWSGASLMETLPLPEYSTPDDKERDDVSN